MHRDHHFGYLLEEKDSIIRSVKETARRCGETIADDEISFPGLKKDGYSTDCLLLQHEATNLYCEHPLAWREGDGPKVPRPDLHENVFRYLQERIWRDLKSRCLANDSTPHAHDDGTRNTIWNERHISRNPDLQTGMSKTGGEMRMTTRMGADGSILVAHDTISIRSDIPESAIVGHTLRPLKDIIRLPHCGDDQVQVDFEEQLVFAMERSGDTVILKTSGILLPVMGTQGVYPWREMRKMARDQMVFATNHDPVTYDIEGDIARYIEQTGDFFERHGTPESHYRVRMAA